jgi:hypothetical protein
MFMKRKSIINTVIAFLLSLVFTACQKEILLDNPALVNPATPLPDTNPPPPGGGNTAVLMVEALAGYDFTVMIPPDTFYLHSSANIWGAVNPQDISWQWRSISGPTTPRILHTGDGPDKVQNILPGKYDFELTFSLKSGFSDKDTVTVNVLKYEPVLANEIVISDLNWKCDWGFCNLQIPDVFTIVQGQKAFQVYIRRDFFTDWLLLTDYFQTKDPWSGTGNEYHYYVVGNKLTIEGPGLNFTDHPKIKLVY